LSPPETIEPAQWRNLICCPSPMNRTPPSCGRRSKSPPYAASRRHPRQPNALNPHRHNIRKTTMDKPSFTIAPDGARVVALEKGYEGHEGLVRELRLRPPTYKDFMELGDPTVLIVSANAMVPQDDLVTIRRYAEELSGGNPILMDRLTLQDALALRDAVKSFFSEKSANTSTISPIT
jgi:hypothetical protein